MLQNRKTASFDLQINNEEMAAYVWMKVLSILSESKLLK